MSDNSSKAALRRLLQAVLISDSDLEAFCIDYFPDVSRRFSSGMDRIQKLSMLLAAEDPQEILARLAEAEPARFARNRALLQSEPAALETAEPPQKSGSAPNSLPVRQRVYDRVKLFEFLCAALESQFNAVVFHLNLRTAVLIPKTNPQSDRALQIVEVMESEGAAGLLRLTDAIAKVAPQLLK